MDYFDHLELRAGQDVLWVARSVAVPEHVWNYRVRPGDARMRRILSQREDPVALRRFCVRSLSHLQVGRLTDAQLASAVESELESGRLCALVFTLGDAHTAEARVESARRAPPPQLKPIITPNAAVRPAGAAAPPGVARPVVAKPVVAQRVVAPTIPAQVHGPAAAKEGAASVAAPGLVPDDPDMGLKERFDIVVGLAIDKSPDNVQAELERLRSPENIATVLGTFALLMLAYGFGVGEAATAALLAWAYIQGGWAAVVGVTRLVEFVVLFYNAKTNDDLEKAADALSKAAIALVEVGLTFILHRMASRITWPAKAERAQRRAAPRNPEPQGPRPRTKVDEEDVPKLPVGNSPAGFNPKEFDPGTRKAFDSLNKSDAGKISKQLDGKPLGEVKSYMDAYPGAKRSTQQLSDGKVTQTKWELPDGTVVRVKETNPPGGYIGPTKRSEPTLSVSVVKRDPSGALMAESYENEAFKISKDGLPVPKGPEQVDTGTLGKDAARPLINKAMDAGHRSISR